MNAAAAALNRKPAISPDGPVLIAGAGVAGKGSATLVHALGLPLAIADDNQVVRRELAESLGAADLSIADAISRVTDYRLVVTSPGWRPDSALLVAAEEKGVEVIGDVELAYRIDQAGLLGEPHTWYAITGTNGKTTTTQETEFLLRAGGVAAQAVGNIGTSFAEAMLSAKRVDILVAELSSFQLHWSSTFHAEAAVILNIAEDHLDWHGSFEAYAGAKANLLASDVVVVGLDDPEVNRLVRAHLDEGAGGNNGQRVYGFTLKDPASVQLPGLAGVLGVRDGELLTDFAGSGAAPARIGNVEDISPTGPAGTLDALAAAGLALNAGVEPDVLAGAFPEFKVAGHRGEVVGEYRGTTWIDNSKATNPHAAEVALAGYHDVHWVAGGQLKGADIKELVDSVAPRIKRAYLMGVDAAELALALAKHHIPVFHTSATDPEEALEAIIADIFDNAVAGDTVILAPAAASLDMFSGMGQRGDMFAATAARYAAENLK